MTNALAPRETNPAPAGSAPPSHRSTPSVRAPSEVEDPAARRRILWSVLVALAVVVSAVASLNIALPDLAKTTNASQSQLQWIVDAYSVVFAGLLLPAGALGDRFGRKRTLIAGLIVFGAAYGLAAAATGPSFLIVCRAFAGWARPW